MTSRSHLRVLTSPVKGLTAGQCFWNQEEELIEYHTIPTRAYASSIQNDVIRIDVDGDGWPVFIEVAFGSAMIEADLDLASPMDFSLATHRFLDFPICFPYCRIIASPDKSLLFIVLSEIPAVRSWMSSEGVIWEADRLGRLSGIWMTDITPDPSGRKSAAWRSECWRQYRRNSMLRRQRYFSPPVRSISQSDALGAI